MAKRKSFDCHLARSLCGPECRSSSSSYNRSTSAIELEFCRVRALPPCSCLHGISGNPELQAHRSQALLGIPHRTAPFHPATLRSDGGYRPGVGPEIDDSPPERRRISQVWQPGVGHPARLRLPMAGHSPGKTPTGVTGRLTGGWLARSIDVTFLAHLLGANQWDLVPSLLSQYQLGSTLPAQPRFFLFRDSHQQSRYVRHEQMQR